MLGQCALAAAGAMRRARPPPQRVLLVNTPRRDSRWAALNTPKSRAQLLPVVTQPCLSLALACGAAGALINDGLGGAPAGEIKREAAVVCMLGLTCGPDAVFVAHTHRFV